MRTLSAREIKRRGVAAIEELLGQGPVHILKNNRPACVVLSEAEYERLSRRKSNDAGRTAWDILLAPAAKGMRTREEIDAQMQAERDAWNRP
jgi:PHD/YefM family antitoxin component YafN of YafNO toxin-antitoxin module